MNLKQIPTLYELDRSILKMVNEGFQNTMFEGPDLIIRLTSSTRRTLSDIETEVKFVKELAKAGATVS